MHLPTNVFQEYLSPDETVIEADDGAIVDEKGWTEGVVGLTDRRLLFVSEDGDFTDVGYDHVCSIRSRTRRTLTPRGRRLLVLGAFGGLLALGGFSGSIWLSSGVGGTLLVLASVLGVVCGEAVRRRGIGVDWGATLERVPGVDATSVGHGVAAVETAADGGDRTEAGGGSIVSQHWETEYVYVHWLVLCSSVIVAGGSIAGLFVHTGGALAALCVLAAIGGLAATEFAVRRKRRLDDVGANRQSDREVHIELVNGRDVSVRFDATTRIDRVLSRLTGVSAPKRVRGSGEKPIRT